MRLDTFVAAIAIAMFVALLGCTSSTRRSQEGEHVGQSAAHGDQSHSTTVDIQGAGEWKRSPHMRAYYDATVATFVNGTDIDVDAYEARSFAIFREFARANGMNEQAMIDHLKLIPRQVVDIVKDDPAVLQSYDAFWAALAGPD